MTTASPLPPRGAGKAAWRDWARSQRSAERVGGKAPGAADRDAAIAAHLRGWDPFRKAEHVLAYLALPGEPDLAELLGSAKPEWYVTRTWPDADRPLTVHAYRPGDLETHRYGFRQPGPDAARTDPARIDLVLVPGLAFDAAGTRLGRGLGYYDRLLGAMRPQTIKVGVATESCLVPRLPRDPHDVPMDYLVGESGVRAVVRPEPEG